MIKIKSLLYKRRTRDGGREFLLLEAVGGGRGGELGDGSEELSSFRLFVICRLG